MENANFYENEKSVALWKLGEILRSFYTNLDIWTEQTLLEVLM